MDQASTRHSGSEAMTSAELAPTSCATGAPARERRRIHIEGQVQGVGFRPFVYQLAQRFGLSGFVRNDSTGVLIEVEGCALDAFVRGVQQEAPPTARIRTLSQAPLPLLGDAAFSILASERQHEVRTLIGVDRAVCAECLEELFDPGDRRHRHPFINCTHCGPRHTITRALPYDRAQTSMAPFAMCADCAREYADPRNRRFHAEAIACPNCGPQLAASIESILAAIRAGEIVALKGLGGFHLVCDSRNAEAVARLRQRKGREAKPFAVMAASVAAWRRVAEVDAAEARWLEDAARPIVLLPLRPDAGLAPGIAPGLGQIGAMLPSTPIQYLLFHEAAGRPSGSDWLQGAPPDLCLVMTSANRSEEPLVIDESEAAQRLAGIADRIVGHDRAILSRCDDSVLRVIDGAPCWLRRARGLVPEPIELAQELPPLVALGGHLKNTFCVVRGREAFVSQHIGDLDQVASASFFRETLEHLLRVLDLKPQVLAHDAHPDFLSTRIAGDWGLPTVAVQHHAAHLAAVAAEHGLDLPVAGLALDGYGYGEDGAAWGGEWLRLDSTHCARLGHLRPLQLPGGDRAAREPWRVAAALLHELGRGAEISTRYAAEPHAGRLQRCLQQGLPVAGSSSCGRYFDAAAALLGVCTRSRFEGEAAMRLEALVRVPRVSADGYRIEGGVLDLRPLWAQLAELGHARAELGAEYFHGTLAAGLAELVDSGSSADRRVLLGGGCAVNRPFLQALRAALARRGRKLLTALRLPPNDGGLSLGQAWYAGLKLLRDGGP